MGKKIAVVVIVLILFIGGCRIYFNNYYYDLDTEEELISLEDTIPEPTFEYGIQTDSFTVHKGVIQPNEFLANILLKYKIPYPEIDKLVKEAEGVFNVKNLHVGKNYTIMCSNDSLEKAQCFIYEPNAVEYVVFDMRDSLRIYKERREITTKIKTTSGVITSSLYKTLQDEKVSPVLAIEMANVYAWSIDFYRIQENDWFKVMYEEKFVDGQSIGIGKVLAAEFNHSGKNYNAYYFEQDSVGDYFDAKANSLRRAFLKSPLEFGRLTSGFTMKRFHPVQKRNKPHLGTDYAAPKGTPILATGNGVVIESAHKVYNGNYVKIKHNSTYTTQYLHMTKRAVKTGQSVKQGDVIGYVGSTGLATGPHVCYRFWKNGQQVNHLNEDFPPSEPIKPAYKAPFELKKAEFDKQLQKVKVKGLVS
ncbi:MAG: peptidoglycan DD-metalloendopeptidase family protein [Flavobacteriales bacterium]|nr:peptidoglycan DD-metalloendopeptidase family protein [Flavobacteriales bacterium]MCB9364392.1 peptidoglycan DD-metalloendopeptidase family protein [Flavobacteriales bacterium]